MAKFTIQIDSNDVVAALRDSGVIAKDPVHFTKCVVDIIATNRPITGFGRTTEPTLLERAINKAISIVIDCDESASTDT